MDYGERCNAKASTFGLGTLPVLYDAPGTMVLECLAGCGSITSQSRIGKDASTVADEGWM